MIKKVVITNGSGRCGKDTFAELLSKYVTVYKYSSIDKVKRIAKECGWTGEKTERDRKFLSNIKLLTSEYNNMPFEDVQSIVNDFNNDLIKGELLLIDIREPEEIKKAVKEFNAITVLIQRDNIDKITSNMADANVDKYNYDCVIKNNGTLNDLNIQAKNFYDSLKHINCMKNKCDIDCIGCKNEFDDDGAIYCNKELV